MREKSYGKRTLSDRNASYLKFPNKLQKYSRFLNKNRSKIGPSTNLNKDNAERNVPQPVRNRRDGLKNPKGAVTNATTEHTQDTRKNVFEDGAKKSLTRSNLKKLQEKIFDKELNDIFCDHCLCSTENRKDIKCSRLWFLFELEMSENWNENLRLSCYNKYVYSAIDKSWKMDNILLKEQEKYYEYFPVEQLLIPNNIEYHSPWKRQENIEDLTVEIDSVIETNLQKGRLLPESLLIRRENEIGFSDFQLDARKILNDLSATSENPFNSSSSGKKNEIEEKTLEIVSEKKANKKILGALERKLHGDRDY